MTTGKDIFLDKSIRTGGFCELAIQVCPSIDNEPIRLYTDFIWTLKNVDGPFDTNFNSTTIDIANIEHEGILHLDSHAIPFKTYNIREDNPVETGFNWFDICFYEGTIEKVFGHEECQTWSEDAIIPTELKNFLHGALKQLFKIYPFQLAIIGFEVSGQYYLDFFKKPLTSGWTPPLFFVGRDNHECIATKNKNLVTIIDESTNE